MRIYGGSRVGEDTEIGEDSEIGEGARIGNHVTMSPLVFIDKHAEIGDGSRIGKRARIGANKKLPAGSVVDEQAPQNRWEVWNISGQDPPLDEPDVAKSAIEKRTALKENTAGGRKKRDKEI